MRLLLLGFLAACGAARGSQVPVEPTKPVSVTPTVQLARDLDEAQVVAKSHAWFDAFDRLDLAGFSDPLGPSFVLFEEGRFFDRALLAKGIASHKERHVPIASRTWSEERVFLGGNTAVFIGRAVEHVPAHGDNPAHDQDGYNTLVWVRDGARWQISHWQWSRAGMLLEKQRWNDTYTLSVGFNKKPNQLLVDVVKGKKSGTALDIAMGQGRNALFLAASGWKTTGVDISEVGLRQAREAAAKQKLRLDTIEADIEKYDLGVAKWDLVTLIYAGDDAKLVERIKSSLRKDGLFVCEYFHTESEIAKAGAGGWDTGELAALFRDGYTILRDEVVDDHADWAGQRKTKLVRFVAQKR